MDKTYIFDTSVIISEPTAIKQFPNADIILPVVLLEEVDKLKKQFNDAGKNARAFVRLLDQISEMGDISVGIMLDNKSIIKVDTTTYPSDFGNSLYGDTHILSCAYHTNKATSGNAVLLTNDINLRVRARALGISCESYVNRELATSELYAGVQYIQDEEAGTKLSKDGSLIAADYEFKLNPNECVIFTDSQGIEIAKGRLRKSRIKYIPTINPWGLAPRNNEQEILIDLIMDPKISLVTVAGNAGTGKTLCTIASALELVLHKKSYEKVIIYRPIQSVGPEIGFLPGSLMEKISVHFGAVMDSFEVLLSGAKQGNGWKQELEMFQKKGRIEMDAITFVRGRSIPNSLIILDEAQNITSKDIKTLLTRAGEGSKIILLGDIEQIDNTALDASNNGLTAVIDKFKNWDAAAHITLVRGERSVLASKAAELL